MLSKTHQGHAGMLRAHVASTNATLTLFSTAPHPVLQALMPSSKALQ